MKRVAATLAFLTVLAILAGPAALADEAYTTKFVTLSGKLDHKSVAPGGTVNLVLTAAPIQGWHVYALANKPSEVKSISKPTVIVLTDRGDLKAGRPVADSKVIEKPDEILGGVQRFYKSRVSWTVPLTVPTGTTVGVHTVEGLFGFQSCSDATCDLPRGVSFKAKVIVAAASQKGDTAVDFADAKYRDVTQAAEKAPAWDDVSSAPVTPAKEPVTPGKEQFVADSGSVAAGAAPMMPIGTTLLLAFLGGIILNVMPCVLPVIGLKIFAFMEQGGQSRSKTFLLNVSYSFGMISVFLVLAALAVTFQLGWGQLFQYPEFNIVMAAVIFTMGLSFLGIWEIPIPGFIGTHKVTEIGEKEGYEGAFAKGTITTLLATPCTGPFMSTALVGVLRRPAPEIFAIFSAIGVGMASPYLIIGAFPQTVRFLPKPGEWMNTFKQIMGFVLIGTVVYLLTLLKPEFVVPTVALLFGLWFACWWIGRVHATAGRRRWRALGEAILVGSLVGMAAFYWLAPVMRGRLDSRIAQKVDLEVERRIANGEAATGFTVSNKPWQPYTARKLQWLLDNKKTVLIDFTADWCPNCKLNEARVLKTDATAEVLEKHGVYTLVADWTHYDEAAEVTAKLEELGVKNIPLVAIYPANAPEKPILIPGVFNASTLYKKIRQAGSAAGGPVSATAMRAD